jgi:hypothetical protein
VRYFYWFIVGDASVKLHLLISQYGYLAFLTCLYCSFAGGSVVQFFPVLSAATAAATSSIADSVKYGKIIMGSVAD